VTDIFVPSWLRGGIIPTLTTFVMETLCQAERTDRLVTDRILRADTEEGSDDKVKGLHFSDSFVLPWLIPSV